MKDIATSQLKFMLSQLKFILVNFVDCACIDETKISIVNMSHWVIGIYLTKSN